jgi:hypothetical protein
VEDTGNHGGKEENLATASLRERTCSFSQVRWMCVFTVGMLIASTLRTQIWTVIAVYLLVAVLKKRLHLDASLYTVLQILSLALFENMPISQALAQLPIPAPPSAPQNHQCLLGF